MNTGRCAMAMFLWHPLFFGGFYCLKYMTLYDMSFECLMAPETSRFWKGPNLDSHPKFSHSLTSRVDLILVVYDHTHLSHVTMAGSDTPFIRLRPYWWPYRISFLPIVEPPSGGIMRNMDRFMGVAFGSMLGTLAVGTSGSLLGMLGETVVEWAARP